MKAIVYTKYGPPEVLQLKEVAKPTPRDDEVLIKVQAVSVNRSDWEGLKGKPLYASSLLCETNPEDLFSPCCIEADLLPQS